MGTARIADVSYTRGRLNRTRENADVADLCGFEACGLSSLYTSGGWIGTRIKRIERIFTDVWLKPNERIAQSGDDFDSLPLSSQPR